MSVLIEPVSLANTSYFGVVSCHVVSRSSFHSMLEDDLEAVFFNNSEFAETALYTHKTGEIENYSVIFNDPFAGINLDPQAQVSSRNVVIKIQEKKIKRYPTSGDTLLFRGIKYKIDDFRPDGVGVIELYLDRI